MKPLSQNALDGGGMNRTQAVSPLPPVFSNISTDSISPPSSSKTLYRSHVVMPEGISWSLTFSSDQVRQLLSPILGAMLPGFAVGRCWVENSGAVGDK